MANDPSMTVQRAEMAKAAEHLKEHMGEIKRIQDTLQGQIDNLMGRWKGNAATAFKGAHVSFNGRFEEVQAELRSIQEKVTESQSAYTTVEAQNEDATKAITQALNF